MRSTTTEVVVAVVAGGLFYAIASPALAEPFVVSPNKDSGEVFLEPRLPNGELTIDSLDAEAASPAPQRVASASQGSCGAGEPESCVGQIGTGSFLQECNDGNWAGLAFPIMTGGGMIDTVTFTVNTNRAGGDVYITTNTTDDEGVCQPDVTGLCPGDLNHSGAVGAEELAQLLAAW